MNTENLTEAPKKQTQTSIFYSIVALLILAPPLYVGFLALANLLPPDDALRVKSFVDTIFKSLATSVGVGGPLFLYFRSNMLTWFKGANQTPATDPATTGDAQPE